MDYTRNTLRAAIKAMDDVVTPAVDSTQQAQAMEQVRLATNFLRFAEQRMHLIGDRENYQLRESVELARQIESGAAGLPALEALQTARKRAAGVLTDSRRDSTTVRRTTAEIESKIRRVVTESVQANAVQRRKIEVAVLTATSKQIEADRAWLLPLQFDADPGSVSPVATALGLPVADESEPA